MSEIKYRISSVTSQHAKYPASRLLQSQSSGWQSAINCSYPQSLTIQFYVPIRTKKLQLIFHQYKIPQLIDVFVKLGARENYRKLGFVLPNDNAQSSYQEKEEKSLYFEFSCTHIRFVLHENYKCDMNIFNQVALEDLIVLGEILTHREIEGVELDEDSSSEDEATQSLEMQHNERTLGMQHNERTLGMQHNERTLGMQHNERTLEQRKHEQQNRKEDQLSHSSEITLLFRDIYAKLQTQKQQAVGREEYQKASHVKNILANFKNLQNEIRKLEREKSQALRSQDYDRCHRLKNEINKKKEVVQYQRQDLLKNQEHFYTQNSYSSRLLQKDPGGSNDSKKKQAASRDINQFKSPEAQRKLLPSNPSVNQHDQQVVPAVLNKGKNSFENLPLETNEKRRDPFIEFSQSAIPEKRTESDNASLKKDINELKQGTDRQIETSMVNESFRVELQPLENKLKMRVENYFSFIPEIYWQFCEHKNWKGKLEAVKLVRSKVEEVQTKEQFMAILEIISRIIISKQATISAQSLEILLKLTDIDIQFSLQHLPFFVEEIIAELLHFFNDTNKNVKELALKTYLLLPRISFLSISVVIRELIKHKNRVKNEPKLIITKLELMTRLIETYKESEYHFKQILNWILQFLQDPNQKVRVEAGNLLIALTYLVGSERIIKAIEAVNKPGLFELVLNYVNNSSFEHSKANIDQSKLSLENSKLQHEFYGSQAAKVDSKHSLGKVLHPVPTDRKERMEQSKNSRKESSQMHVQLSYSQQSAFQQSLQHGSKASHHQNQDQGQIRVLDPEEGLESDSCMYCGQRYQNERQHYIQECKVLAFCQKCSCLIYIREFTEHFLKECEKSHLHRQCKKCGLAFEIGQINEHIGKDACKKKLGVNWERCQFCGGDILGEDKFWTEHALVCNGLPDKRQAFHRLQLEQEEHSSSIYE